METKSNTIIIGLLALLIGLAGGYMLRGNTNPSDSMSTEMGEHMYEDDMVSDDGAMMHAMDEMMRDFRGKTGEAYEKAFLEGMIVHHLGAISMAEGLLKQTNRPELVELANNIIQAQTDEVDMMKEWLATWFNEN